MEQEIIITFDNHSRGFILDSLGLKGEGKKIVDSDMNNVQSVNNEEINVKEFGGVLKGSKVFIKNDSSDLVQFFLSSLEKKSV